MGEDPPPERRVNEALLQHLQGIAADVSGITRTSLFPANRQETLVVEFEPAYYPDTIETIRLEVRAYTNGEFHISYLESYLGDLRQCRWDRHTQPHNSRDHFHPLPDAGTQQAADHSFPVDLTDVLRTLVLPWVEQRLGDLWDEDRQ